MIEQQVTLEREMLDAGVKRYQRITTKAEQAGRAAETSYAQRLMPSLCRDLADAVEIAKYPVKKIGIHAKFVAFLQRIDSNKAAYLTLRVVFDALIKGSTLGNLALTLGQRVEDDVRFTEFEKVNPLYYKRIIEDFKRKNTTAYRHKHRVLVKKSEEKNDGWLTWTVQERMLVGTKLIELMILSTGIIEKKLRRLGPMKTVAYVEPTEDALEWIHDHTSHAELLHPEVAPCLMPPNDWTGLNTGGYFTAAIRRRVPFVKTHSTAHRDALVGADFTEAMDSANALQRTPWSVNLEVLDVMKEVWRRNLRIGMPPSEPIEIPECPLAPEIDPKSLDENDPLLFKFKIWKREAALSYTQERERMAKSIQLSRVLIMSEKYREVDRFYYVYTCDFRGRVYAASPGLSPQGADFSKGLLHFADGKALGPDGAYWLAVQGSNVFGYDKATYDERVQFIQDNEEAIRAVAKNPMGSDERSYWGDADKPYQFLSFCFEWAKYLEQGNSFESRIAVALDGSCNGLQNFSAMLRDSVGGAATNLTPSDKPQDIYQRVADVCVDKLNALTTDFAAQWLSIGISRKLTKKPVMTLPYGSTKQSCREHIEAFILEIEQDFWIDREMYTAAAFLSRELWASIGEVVIAARAAMDWLQKASRVLSKSNHPMVWTTPTGFRVYQGSMQMSGIRIQTQLCGRLMLTVTSPTKFVNSYRQANGIAPNFVHSMDASHLVKTVLEGLSRGIKTWAMVHDSYGTYPCDTPALATSLRIAFYKMYTDNDVLQQWKVAQEEAYGVVLPSLPPTGTLDLSKVLESPYFFG